jgi:hypothetical protein
MLIDGQPRPIASTSTSNTGSPRIGAWPERSVPAFDNPVCDIALPFFASPEMSCSHRQRQPLQSGLSAPLNTTVRSHQERFDREGLGRAATEDAAPSVNGIGLPH